MNGYTDSSPMFHRSNLKYWCSCAFQWTSNQVMTSSRLHPPSKYITSNRSGVTFNIWPGWCYIGWTCTTVKQVSHTAGSKLSVLWYFRCVEGQDARPRSRQQPLPDSKQVRPRRQTRTQYESRGNVVYTGPNVQIEKMQCRRLCGSWVFLDISSIPTLVFAFISPP